MKKIIIRTLLFFGLATLVVFSIATVVIAQTTNRAAAKDHAAKILSVYESQMINEQYQTQEDYAKLVKRSGGLQDMRVSVLSVAGMLLADTDLDDVDLAENHLGRKEIEAALRGEVGSDTRASATLKTQYLYMAKLVSVSGAETVILRIAVPVSSINTYLVSILLTTAILFAVIATATFLIAKLAANKVNQPFVLIKERLGGVLDPSSQTNPIILTKYDDINVVLQEIDEVSERLAQTLAGNESEKQKLGLILENIDQGIIGIDNENKLVFCNQMAEEYFCFAYSDGLPLERAIRNLAVLGNIATAIDTGEVIIYDHMRGDGQTYEIRYYPIVTGGIRLIITVQNVTEIRKTGQEKQEFFANAGHELNTPLSSVIGYSEMMLEEKKYNQIFAETIHREALRMKLLISDMLKISELEENGEIAEEQVDFKKVIEEAVTAAKPKAESKNIRLVTRLEPCIILAERQKIAEVADNLIDNAIKYTNAGGRVDVFLEAQNGRAVLSVKDNGIGIPQASLSRVFERFYRVDKARTAKEGGTGLGLSIVKHICGLYQAPISIQSKEGAGTEITVSFVLQ